MKAIPIAQILSGFWHAGVWNGVLTLGLLAGLWLFGVDMDPMLLLVVALFSWAILLLVARRLVVRRSMELLVGEGSRERIVAVDGHQVVQQALWMRNREFYWPNADPRKKPFGSEESLTTMYESMEIEMTAWYLPLQALVWSLPAAGFVGTTWHLRHVAAYLGDFNLSAATPVPESAMGSMGPAISAAFLIVSVSLVCAAISYVATALSVRSELYTLQRLRGALHPVKPA